MASLITVRINKGDSPNLGFRLQGGKDFGTPLVIQKVNGGSPAERAGLIAGDSVIKINNTDVFNLRHKDAQDVVVRAGHNFEITIQRGGSTWKPSVIPTGQFSTPTPNINNISPVTRTSLAAQKTENIGAIGTGHNLAAKPFSPQLNGAVNGGPKLVNKQYNSPVKLYSEESIAETLSAQTEVLSTGALGVNFKKNEKNYDASNSAVLRMLKESENEPKTPDEVSHDFYSTHSHAIGGRKTVPAQSYPPIIHTRSPSSLQGEHPKQSNASEAVTVCTDCERVIVGVFVRIKDKNLHVECFKCSTCGSSLKNVGYYNINNKLYCDIHAKSAALKNSPNPNLVPITVPPGGKAPVHAISSALSSHSLPTQSPLSPKINNNFAPSYQEQENNENVDVSSSVPVLPKSNSNEASNNNSVFSPSTPLSYRKFLNKTTNVSGPKPFSSVTAPIPTYNTLPKAAPLSPVAPPPAPHFNNSYNTTSYSPISTTARAVDNVVWPPPQESQDLPTACPIFYPPPSQVEHSILNKKIEKESELRIDCSENCLEVQEINAMAQFLTKYPYEYSSGCRSTTECRETITETLDTQKLVEDIVKTRQPPPLDKDMPSFTETRREQNQYESSVASSEDFSSVQRFENTVYSGRESCELKRPTQYSPNTLEVKPSRVENAVPQKWESVLTQAIRTTAPDEDTFAQIPTKFSHTPLASALSIAPSQPFHPATVTEEPVPLPEETVPYLPPERPVLPVREEELKPKQERPKSQFVRALQTVPDSPKDTIVPASRKKKKDSSEKYFEELPKPQEKLSMLAALTTAPDRPYSPLVTESVGVKNKSETKSEVNIDRSQLNRPTKPDVLPESFQVNKKDPKPPSYYSPAILYQRTQESACEEQSEESDTSKVKTVQRETIHNPEVTQIVVDNGQPPQQFPPLFQGFSCSFQNKSEHSQFSVSVNTTPPVMSPIPKTPSVKTIESKPGYVQKETITESEHKRQQKTKKHEQTKEEETKKEIQAAKQAEEIVVKKTQPPVTLHKPQYLPQYQVELSAEAEAQLHRMEKMEQAQVRLEQQKIIAQQQQEMAKPMIKIETVSEVQPAVQMFKPIPEERPPSQTFSPRPGSITPSIINKPPPVLPYYQANLVAQPMRPLSATLFDPKSPAVSRSPSPCPGRGREVSPSPTTLGNVRPVSPAPGPPPNPLQSHKPLPNPHDSKVDQARDSLTTYIPEHMTKQEMIEAHGANLYRSQPTQMYTSRVQTQSYPVEQQRGLICKQEVYDSKKMDVSESHKAQKYTSQSQDTVMSTAVEEQIRQAHMEQLRKSQSESLERSADGRTQVQRKKVVTEEFERSQKETNIQIEKNVTTTKKLPFCGVKDTTIEASTVKGHMTDPHKLSYSYKKVTGQAREETSAKSSIISNSQGRAATDASASIKHVYAPSTISPVKHVVPPSSSKKPSQNVISPSVSQSDTGAGSGRQMGGVSVAPKRGRGVLNAAALAGTRIPLCGHCNMQIRGPFITALGKIWCPNHFICATPSCRRPLQDLGFVEEKGQLYCEYCFEQYLAPQCSKCSGKIKGDCLKAIGKNFHPECFNCTYCGKLFGNSPFFLEDGSPYCEADWNELFTTKCFACGFPVEAGDRWVEALNNNYHSQCFNCTMCKKNLEGQSFFAKGGRPFCKNHAR
ncbi:Z band alternatively spliced PDZ-motif protein 52 isoform X1 [Leptinotarsa decemlineata]|uniref:Z band alternatively spliced PDZ-motif protein 52 isoform X1 n=1 Tax=Leptinotarsa decemlineata TaxID=7539 RepID=UPI003D3089A1